MKIKFTYSKTHENEKLIGIQNEYQWFLDNNFPIILPKFYSQLYQDTKGHKRVFQQKLSKELNKIYDKNKYASKIMEVRNDWDKVEPEFLLIAQDVGLKINNNYICCVSLYGPQGQFHYPNTIDLRLANSSDIKFATETIAHEILHLAIFNKAKRLKLDYKQTEGVVDLLFKETKLKVIFPKYKLQNIAVYNKLLFEKIIPKRK